VEQGTEALAIEELRDWVKQQSTFDLKVLEDAVARELLSRCEGR